MEIVLCPVVASIDLVRCENLNVFITQSRGTVCVDMSADIVLDFGAKAHNEIAIFTSSCETISLKSDGRDLYTIPKGKKSRSARYITRMKQDNWSTAECNTYGDAIESQPDAV